jgi:ABC-type glycerol-3-phosphate transport system substrate-binding protein
MNKKTILVIVLIFLVGTLLGGCQPAADTDDGGGDASSEEVTITVWDFGGSEFAWMDNIVIPEFQEKNPNIKVDHIGVLEDEMALKLETAIAAGEIPDIVVFPPARVIAAGHVLPLDDFMARDGISRDDFSPLFQSWNVFTGGKIENKVVSLPLGSNLWGMVYNKDLFADAGLPELGPDDYIDMDTWLEYARAINKPSDALEDRVWGSAMFQPVFNSGNNNMSSPFILGDDGRTCEGNSNNADWINAWEALYTAYAEDLTPQSAGAMIDESQQDEMFGQGKVGMTYGTLGDAIFARSQGLNVGITGQPVVTPGWEGNAGGWNDSYGIMAATEHPNEAWTFLKFLSTEAALNIPFGADMLQSDGDTAGITGLPGYLPLHEQGQFAEQIANDSLVAASAEVMSHIVPPPFTVDPWTSMDEFWNIFSMVEDEGMSVEEAVNQATATCQEVTDQLWETFDSFSE